MPYRIYLSKLIVNIIFSFAFLFFFQGKVLALDVLWFGNSYSDGGSAAVFQGLYQSNSSLQSSSPLYIERYLPGGTTIYDHMNSAAEVNALNSRTWDYVVIQDQSQTPAYSFRSYANYVKGGGTLKYDQFMSASPGLGAYNSANWQAKKDLLSLATSGNSTTKVIVFETWARDFLNSNSAPVLNYIDPTSSTMSQRADTMLNYNRLEAEAYELLNPGRIDIARVGEAFDYASDQIASNSLLYNPDGSHGSNFGYYLAGSEIFETITGVSSVGNSYRGALSSADALKYQTFATNFNAIPEPSSLWYLGICGIFFVTRYMFKRRSV